MRKLWRLEPAVRKVFAYFRNELGEVHFYVTDLRWSTEHNQHKYTGFAIVPGSERPLELELLESQLESGDWPAQEKMRRVRGFAPKPWSEVKTKYFPAPSVS